MPTKAAASSMPSAHQQSQAPFRPMAANGQHTSNSIAPAPLKRAPSRKRGRAALAEEQGTATSVSIVDAAASTQAPPTVSHDAARGLSASNNGQVKPESDAADAGVNPAAVDHQLNHSGTARPTRKPRQIKASAAIKQEETSEDIKQEPAGLSDTGELLDGSAPAAIIDGQSTKPAAKPRRKPRQSKAAAAAAEQEHQQKQQAVKHDPESASDADMSDVSFSAAPAANDIHAEVDAGSKAKPKRKPRQTKAGAAAAAAAAQSGDAAASNSKAAPAPAKLDRRKKVKIEKVVAEVKAEVAQEAAEQEPAVAEAPVAGMDEHQPRKIPRTTKSAAAASTGVTASETSEESDAAAKAPAKAKGRARVSRPRKAPAPDDGATAGLPEASEGTTCCAYTCMYLHSGNMSCRPVQVWTHCSAC